MKYKETLGFGNKYSFGTEIEFEGVFLEYLASLYSKTNLPVQFVHYHKSLPDLDYSSWYLDQDSSITIHKNGKALGGELSSRILTDTKEIWIELEKICSILKKTSAYASASCSNHIWIDLSPVTNKRYFFEVLSKVLVLFEKEMQHFYMGESFLVRKTAFTYARSLAESLIHHITTVDFNDDDYFYRFRSSGDGLLFSRNDGINLQSYLQNHLMEIRYPNGTLEEQIIQNNILFSLCLVDAIRREVFDPEELTRKIENLDKKEWLFELLFNEPNYNNFLFFAKAIARTEEDCNAFVGQYEQVLSKKTDKCY